MISNRTPSELLAWCSQWNNMISIMNIRKNKNYGSFVGAQIRDVSSSLIVGSWTHVKEILGTRLLISLHYGFRSSANMEIFDLSKKRQMHKIYALGDTPGSKTSSHSLFNHKRR